MYLSQCRSVLSYSNANLSNEKIHVNTIDGRTLDSSKSSRMSGKEKLFTLTLLGWQAIISWREIQTFFIFYTG
jgi:hypothetical protein